MGFYKMCGKHHEAATEFTNENLCIVCERDQLRAERDGAGRQVVKLREELRIANLQIRDLQNQLAEFGVLSKCPKHGIIHSSFPCPDPIK